METQIITLIPPGENSWKSGEIVKDIISYIKLILKK